MEDRIGLLVARKRYLVGSRVQITTTKKSIHAEKVHLQHQAGDLKKKWPLKRRDTKSRYGLVGGNTTPCGWALRSSMFKLHKWDRSLPVALESRCRIIYYDDNMIFMVCAINMINLFSYVKPPLYLSNNSKMVIIYNLFNVFLGW